MNCPVKREHGVTPCDITRSGNKGRWYRQCFVCGLMELPRPSNRERNQQCTTESSEGLAAGVEGRMPTSEPRDE